MAGLGAFAYLKWTELRAARDLKAVISELDASDPGWRLEDIEAVRKFIPHDENSALVVMRISARLPKNSVRSERFRHLKHWTDVLNEASPDAELEPEVYAEIRREVNGFEPLIDEARSLAPLKDGRYPITYAPDFVGTTMPCQGVSDVVHLLRKDLLIRLREKDVEGALESAQASLVAVRSIGDEPLLSSQYLRIYRDQSIVLSIERILAQDQGSERSLARLQLLLEEEEATPTLHCAVRGHRGGMHDMLSALADGRIKLADVAREWRDRPRSPGLVGGLKDDLEEYASIGMIRRSHAFILRWLSDYLEATKLPPEQFATRHQKLAEAAEMNPETPVLSRILIRQDARVGEVFLRTQAALRCGVVGLAAERFRLANGRWPKDLAELMPAYLNRVPLDPYDGKPLRLRAVADGLAIYSIGDDREDNEGAVDRGGGLYHAGYDIVFRLWDVAERRKPARKSRRRPAAADRRRAPNDGLGPAGGSAGRAA
jgi:hypothetical protein